MKVLGCTGGIGSGKSYVSTIFNRMGIPLYDSDSRAKLLYDTDSRLMGEMVSLLGEEIVADGKIQRSAVAERIFKDPALLAEVEKLVHPAVVRDFERWIGEIETRMGQERKSKGFTPVQEIPFVIIESAILLEKPIVRGCADKTLVVTAPLELRIERVMARDGVPREKVEERMAVQWSDSEREALADFIIFADGKRALMPQILSVYKKMEEL